MKQEQIEVLTPEYLGNFIGTENYHRHGLIGQLLLTDGAHHCANNGLAWFFNIIESTQTITKVRNEEFQSWKLFKNTDKSAIVTATDGNTKNVYLQKIDYTDYPFDKFHVYAQVSEQGLVVMLPSEY